MTQISLDRVVHRQNETPPRSLFVLVFLYSLQDAHLKLQSVQDLHKVVHISQQLVRGGDLLGILVRVVLLQEGQAIHVTTAQPLTIIPVTQTLPLTCDQPKEKQRGLQKWFTGVFR